MLEYLPDLLKACPAAAQLSCHPCFEDVLEGQELYPAGANWPRDGGAEQVPLSPILELPARGPAELLDLASREDGCHGHAVIITLTCADSAFAMAELAVSGGVREASAHPRLVRRCAHPPRAGPRDIRARPKVWPSEE